MIRRRSGLIRDFCREGAWFSESDLAVTGSYRRVSSMRSLLFLTAILLSFPAIDAQVAFSNEAADGKGPSKPRRARVLFIMQSDCPRCDEELQRLRKPGGVFDVMTSVGWKIGKTTGAHIQIVDASEISKFAPALQPADYPAVAGIDGDEVTRYFKTGCTTPLDAWTFGWLLTGKNERPPEAVLEPARAATTGNYRLRGNHWSIDGDWNPTKASVLAHLRSVNHASGAAGYGAIENWSIEELRSLHDDLHEREGGLASGAGYAAARPAAAKPAYMIPKALR